jgi:hypothetical protein
MGTHLVLVGPAKGKHHELHLLAALLVHVHPLEEDVHTVIRQHLSRWWVMQQQQQWSAEDLQNVVPPTGDMCSLGSAWCVLVSFLVFHGMASGA